MEQMVKIAKAQLHHTWVYNIDDGSALRQNGLLNNCYQRHLERLVQTSILHD